MSHTSGVRSGKFAAANSVWHASGRSDLLLEKAEARRAKDRDAPFSSSDECEFTGDLRPGSGGTCRDLQGGGFRAEVLGLRWRLATTPHPFQGRPEIRCQ